MDADMFFCPVSSAGMKACMKNYKEHSQFEMRFILDLDDNLIQMEYNPNCPWYRTMGVYSLDLDVGLDNVRKLLAYAEERGITDFGRLLSIYHNSPGLEIPAGAGGQGTLLADVRSSGEFGGGN